MHAQMHMAETTQEGKEVQTRMSANAHVHHEFSAMLFIIISVKKLNFNQRFVERDKFKLNQ